MACKLKRDNDNNVVGIETPGGESSLLFDRLLNATGDPAVAEYVYRNMYTKEFKDDYGLDFENDPKAKNPATLITDENGEPKLGFGNGYYYVIRPNGTEKILTNSKGQPLTFATTQTASDLSYEKERVLVDTVISFFNDFRNNNPEYFKNINNVKKWFGDKKGKVKGLLAERALAEGFDGLRRNSKGVPIKEDRDKVIAIAEKIKSREIQDAAGVDSELADSGITINEKGAIMLNVYLNWQDVTDKLGNVTIKGFRSSVQEGLEAYGMKVKDDTVEIVDEDDTPIRIHDISRLQESTKDKLSSGVKAFLTDIRADKKNVLGYYTAIPLDEIYSEINEATVDQQDFPGMMAHLRTKAKYNPTLIPVIRKLESLSAQEEAAFYANFANSYKKFLQFRTDKRDIVSPDGQKIGDAIDVKMFDSDQGSIKSKALNFWKKQSIESDMSNPRALYKTNEDGTFEVVETKSKAIVSAYDKIKDLRRSTKELQPADVENLSTLLWNLGIQYGNTLQESTDKLNEYFVKGDVDGATGMGLFRKEVFKPKKGLERLVNAVKENRYIYGSDKQGGTLDVIKEWAAITPFFVNNPAESFLSGAGKVYYPINQPTILDETVVQIKNNFQPMFDTFVQTPLFSPGFDIKHQSPLLSALSNEDVKEVLSTQILDSSKGVNDYGIGIDYEGQSEKGSLIVRLNAFANNGAKSKNTPTYFKLTLPTQADRKRMDFITIPRFEYYNRLGVSLTKREAIKGIIVQDIVTMLQARRDIQKANGDISQLIEGYHFAKGTNPFTDGETGSVFTMPQIAGLNYSQIVDGNVDLIQRADVFLDQNAGAAEMQKIDEILERLVDDVETKLEGYEDRVKSEIERLEVTPADLHISIRNNKNFVKDFVFNDFFGRIEVNKLLRGGMAFAKDGADFYKRMGLVNTPGRKLALQGTLSDPGYGMMPTYKTATIKELGFQDKAVANTVADKMFTNMMEAGVSREEAERISEQYRDVVKTDAQSFISIDMYRGIQQGLGEWGSRDEQAYLNETSIDPTNPNAGKYVDNAGVPVVIKPIKPYHEELKVRDNKPVLHMDKNSYVTVTKELSAEYPVLEKLRRVMQEQEIHVIHEENANKGARKDVRDAYTNNLDNLNTFVLDSTKLRLPQIIPVVKKDKITFSRQIRKNIIGDWLLDPNLNLEFQNLVAENVKEDTKKIENELGLTALRNAKSLEDKRDAKLDHLQKLKERLLSQISEKGLPDSYLGALNIVPNGQFDYRFAIPLAFPNFQAKFEQIYFSLFNNGIFKQQQKGKELVQIAEVGGHIESSELKMYDGTSPAEVMMRRSDLGIAENENIEDLIANNDPRLTVIGYRIPNQGKNSMLPIKVVRFLPESHAKGIIVPGGVTTQMGSDFDIDKMIVIQREDGQDQKSQREQRIFDIMFQALTAPEHLSQVLDPLDGNRLTNKAMEKRGDSTIMVDYNDPLAEIDMEMRNKAGIRLRGSWANVLAGHNIAQQGNLTINQNFAPIIDGVVFAELGKKNEYNSEKFNSSIISNYLSAAVDAAKKPIQIDINDNEFTVPVSGMMLSTGIPVEQVIDFLTQPAIVEAIQVARNKGYNPGQLFMAIREVRAQYKGKAGDSVVDMSAEELASKEDDNQVKMLNNFALFHRAGRSVVKAFKVITPDNLSNVNEMSSLRGWLDTEAEYLSDEDIQLVQGAEEFITEMQNSINEVSPMEVAYRGIFDTVMSAAQDAGFINNNLAFNVFKRTLKQQIGATSFDAATNKLVDKALFLKMMAHQDSPLAPLMSKSNFERLYTDPGNNIGIRLRRLQESSKLKGNIFFENLQQADSNNDKGIPVFTVQLDTSFDAGTLEKNKMTQGFKQMLDSSDPEVSAFAKDLIANQLMTKGFQPGRGTYIDMIPAEVFTTSMLNPALESPVQFFSRIQNNSHNALFFNDFVHDFIRNFGTSRPGGKSLLPRVSPKLIKPDNNGVITLAKNAAPNAYKGKDKGWVAYFTSSPEGKSEIYVRVGEGQYMKLQQKGVPGKVNEVGNASEDSSMKREANTVTGLPSTNVVEQRLTKRIADAKDDAVEIQKICRI